MGGILGQWRILSASVFALALVVGAYLLARGALSPPAAQASEESALLQAIATKDSDGDGLPDWEEAIYGTDPHNPDTRGLGMTDGEAVAKGLIVPLAIADVPSTTNAGTLVDPDLPPAPADNTLTAAFSKNLFTLFIQTYQQKGGDLTDADLSDIANQAFTELTSSITPAPLFKTAKDIKVVGTGPDAMKAYAAAVEAVMQANTADASTSELAYLKSAVEGSDASATDHIASIAKAYRGSAAGIAALPVPRELASIDLALVDTLARLSEVTSDLSRVNDDPVVAMLALKQYPQAILDLTDSFIAIAKSYQAVGITLAPGEPGASIVNLVADIAASQKAAAATP